MNTDPPNKLPKGWHHAKLGEVCHVKKGVTPRREWYSSEGIRIIKFRDIGEDRTINWTPGLNSFVPEEYAGKLQRIRSGMTLLTADAHNPEYIGRKICLAMDIPKEPVFFAGELISVKPKDDSRLINAWPYLWLMSADGYSAIQAKVVGVHLNSGPAKEIEIPIPPLAEQKRIVKLLDKQMAAANRACNIAEEMLSMARAMPDKFLREAFTGKL